MLGGGFLISTLASVQPGGSQTPETAIYSWAQQTNSAKPLQPVPSAYGRTKRMLDYAAVPWSSFEGNDQYVHILLSEGEGFSREQILTGDTSLWTLRRQGDPQFEGVIVGFYNPRSDHHAAFPDQRRDVDRGGRAGTFAYPMWTGGFAAKALRQAGHGDARLVVDVVDAAGTTCTVNDEGVLTTFVPILAQYRLRSYRAGASTGDWRPSARPQRAVLFEEPDPLKPGGRCPGRTL